MDEINPELLEIIEEHILEAEMRILLRYIFDPTYQGEKRTIPEDTKIQVIHFL